MTKAIAVKGLAAASLTPTSVSVVPKAEVAKAPFPPPSKAAPKRRGRPPKNGSVSQGVAQPASSSGDAQPMLSQGDPNSALTDPSQPPRQYLVSTRSKPPSESDLCKTLAESTGLEKKDVKHVLKSLRDTAVNHLRDHNVFRLPDVVVLRRRKTKARPEKKKTVFGKDVVIASKPAGLQVSAFVAKQMKDITVSE